MTNVYEKKFELIEINEGVVLGGHYSTYRMIYN